MWALRKRVWLLNDLRWPARPHAQHLRSALKRPSRASHFSCTLPHAIANSRPPSHTPLSLRPSAVLSLSPCGPPAIAAAPSSTHPCAATVRQRGQALQPPQLAGSLPSRPPRLPSRLPRPPSPRHPLPVATTATAATTSSPWPRARPRSLRPSLQLQVCACCCMGVVQLAVGRQGRNRLDRQPACRCRRLPPAAARRSPPPSSSLCRTQRPSARLEAAAARRRPPSTCVHFAWLAEGLHTHSWPCAAAAPHARRVGWSPSPNRRCPPRRHPLLQEAASGEKKKAAPAPKKEAPKRKAEGGSSSAAAAAVKKERKQYELPGQTRDTPDEVRARERRLAAGGALPQWPCVCAQGGMRQAPRAACLLISPPAALTLRSPQADPLRRFYTSLKEQRPESEMATK